MPTARAELASGPCAGSSTPISRVPTLGKVNTWLEASEGVPLAVGVFVVAPPQAAKIMSNKLKRIRPAGNALLRLLEQ